MAFKDYYRILGVKPDSGIKEIKDAYRRKATDFHPDKHPEKVTDAHAFHEICEAYEVLGSPDCRREYDRGYRQQEDETFSRTSYDAGTGNLRHSGFRQMFDDLFEQIFNGSPVNVRNVRRHGNDQDHIHYDDLTSGRSD